MRLVKCKYCGKALIQHPAIFYHVSALSLDNCLEIVEAEEIWLDLRLVKCMRTEIIVGVSGVMTTDIL